MRRLDHLSLNCSYANIRHYLSHMDRRLKTLKKAEDSNQASPNGFPDPPFQCCIALFTNLQYSFFERGSLRQINASYLHLGTLLIHYILSKAPSLRIGEKCEFSLFLFIFTLERFHVDANVQAKDTIISLF